MDEQGLDVAALLAMSSRVPTDLNNVTEVYFSSGTDVLLNTKLELFLHGGLLGDPNNGVLLYV